MNSATTKSRAFHFTVLMGSVLLYGPLLQAQSDPATPEIVLPSQKQNQNQSGAVDVGQDSSSVATLQMPLKFDGLGQISRDLVAYFSMDDLSTAGLGWSSKALHIKTSGQVEIKQDAGRTYADFSTAGAKLIIDPPLKLGNSYTIAAWLQMPTPKNSGEPWHGTGTGSYLIIAQNALSYWLDGSIKPYAETKSPLNGWYHVAITYDGRITQCYLNATPLEPVKGRISDDLKIIGSTSLQKFDQTKMCAGIDEQYIFSRSLEQDEIKHLMDFSKPSK